jgi:hypothetical protein
MAFQERPGRIAANHETVTGIGLEPSGGTFYTSFANRRKVGPRQDS